MRSLSVIDWICLIVLIIGGINWGLVGFFDFNLVGAIFGPTVSRFIYGLVGICALYVTFVSPYFGRKAIARPHRTVPA